MADRKIMEEKTEKTKESMDAPSATATKTVRKLWLPYVDDKKEDSSSTKKPKTSPNSDTRLCSDNGQVAFNPQAITPCFRQSPADLSKFLPQNLHQFSVYSGLRPPAPPVSFLNPIIASLLGGGHNSSLNENCCAACGSSFRLTSDLVNHMRNNHRSAPKSETGRNRMNPVQQANVSRDSKVSQRKRLKLCLETTSSPAMEAEALSKPFGSF